MKLYLIRHGKTAANEEGRYLGKTDDVLSDNGINEVQNAKLQIGEFKTLFASPMIRCIQTAKILFPDKTPFCIKEWREMEFGEFEGKNYAELNGRADYQAWLDSGGAKPARGGETVEAFKHRIMSGYEIFAAHCRDMHIESAAAVVHGGTIMAMMSELTHEDYYSFQCKCVTGYEMEIDMNSNRILKYRMIGKP